jgi:hypothetical protein
VNLGPGVDAFLWIQQSLFYFYAPSALEQDGLPNAAANGCSSACRSKSIGFFDLWVRTKGFLPQTPYRDSQTAGAFVSSVLRACFAGSLHWNVNDHCQDPAQPGPGETDDQAQIDAMRWIKNQKSEAIQFVRQFFSTDERRRSSRVISMSH